MEIGESCVEELFMPQPDKWLPAVIDMKNMVIGNNRQKNNMMAMGVVPRLLQFMIDENTPMELRLESAVVLGSFAKGTPDNIRALVEASCVSVLLKDINHPDIKYVEACLRCLRTILASPTLQVDLLYQDITIIPHLISIMSKSVCTQECVTTILANCCKKSEHQVILCSNGCVAALAPLLISNNYRVQMPTLKCFAALCYQNDQVASAIATATCNGELIPDLLVKLLSRDRSTEMQMSAAKCLSYLCRAGALDPSNPNISHKTLPTLVRMCKTDRKWEERVEGAETLAYLIETDLDLQRIAAISDHILTTLAEYFRFPGTPVDSTLMPTKKAQRHSDDITVGNELRSAAFRAYAALAANDEEIRKKIIETENLMERLVNGLSDPVTKVQVSAVRCLHSLSRSVQQLRTSLQDHNVWKPLMNILHNATEEVLVISSSTLCNLLLEFSPSKDVENCDSNSRPVVEEDDNGKFRLERVNSHEFMLESGAKDLLVGLTRRDDPSLRLNGIWGLMNLAFQAEMKIKSQILNSLGTEQLFALLSDPNVSVLMKTLGLLRNLLSSKAHIDNIMSLYGTEIMQATILILEGDHPVEVKEQALCILGNVAAGDTAKEFIMGNEDVLKKLMNYMIHNKVKLQIAATFCISNLLWNEDDGALERQAKLREMGVQKLLQTLLSTNDITLLDKVKMALQQF